VDGVGAWLSSEQVDNIFVRVPEGDGPRCLGLDIGINRDATALAVVKQVGHQVVVEHLRQFVPTKRNRVDVSEV
jgi:hypothetical protein